MGAHGLPELPAGYFWRVKNSDYHYFAGAELTMEIRQKRFLGSRSIRSSWVSSPPPWCDSSEVSASDVLDAAIKCLAGWNREKAEVQTVNTLIGDYPPKRLEA